MTKTPFDHVKAIYETQSLDYFDKLDPTEKKTFSPYMINRIISMNEEFVPIVNMVQLYFDGLTSRDIYLFYSQLLPKKKRFDRYVKGVKETKYEPWLIELIAKYFSVSQTEAMAYCDLYYRTDAGKVELRELCERFAVPDKTIKKLKL